MVLLLTSFNNAYSQFNYIAANAQIISGTYTDLGSSGTAITLNYNAGTMTYDDDNSSVQNIGFNFIYNATTFTQFVLNTNGFIKFGSTAPAETYIPDVLSSTETNVIAPFNLDLDAGIAAAEYRVFTSGAAGSRICTIQFKNLREWATPKQYDNINFQIKLYETTNRIEFIYGSFSPSASSSSTLNAVVGIKGGSEIRSVNATKSDETQWGSASFINGNYEAGGYKFDNYNSVLPVSGTTFRFTAAPLTDAEVTTIYTLKKIPANYGFPHVVRAVITNAGATTLTNRPVTLTISGANSFTNTKTVTIAPQSSATVTFDGYNSSVIGLNSITVSLPADDIVANNNGYYLQSVNANTYSYADDSDPYLSYGWGTNAGLFLAKYHVNGTATVSGVNVYLSSSANVGNTVYAVVMNSSGTIIAQSANYVTVSGELNQYKNFTITTPPSLTNADFYVGIAQTANATTAYYPVTSQFEASPTRSGAYYYKSGLGNGLPTEATTYGRFMIQAVLNVTATPPSDPYTNTHWAWMSGDSVREQYGVYGTKGVPSINNKPGARSGAVSWTDSSGYFWLFGGYGNARTTSGLLNDLWKYNIYTNEWTWMKGDSTASAFGVYGNIGVPNSSNKPGARSEAVSWIDNSNNLWLFSGDGLAASSHNYESGLLNDLWKYDISTNQWTWIKGDSIYYASGVYGTQGTASVNNKPGSRSGAVSWKDNSGNLWLFGGIGYLGDGTLHNDLWKYSIATNEWTWVKGDDIANVLGIYGNKGVASINNKPGARVEAVSWKDNSNNLWLFGGDGFPNSGSTTFSQTLNDLWKYNITTNEWTWMNGDSIGFVSGVYGTKGVESPTNKPGGRTGAISWTDKTGKLWLFGGLAGWEESDLNDLWKYNISNNQWTWVKGSNIGAGVDVYGIKGIEVPGSTPGGRNRSVSWIDEAGNIWLFGGASYSLGWEKYNDAWRIYAGSNYIFTGDGDWDIPENWVNYQIGPKNIPGGVSVTIDNFPPGQCNVSANINIQAAGKLTINPTKRLNIISGNLTNAGLLNGFGTVSFSGTPTLLSSSGFIIAPMILSSKSVTLTGTTNTKSITLKNGSFITLDKYDLKMDTGTLVADKQNYFITNDTGRLSRYVSAGSKLFPIGINTTSYTPATITNAGTPDNFSVRVKPGVTTAGRLLDPLTTKNVDRTWLVREQVTGGGTITLTLGWRLEDEQPLFDRGMSYISHFQGCPPPYQPNCTEGFYDARTPTPATGNNPYSQSRDDISNYNTNSFIVTSQEAVYQFLNVIGTPSGPPIMGDGNWSNPDNWLNGTLPPAVIGPGVHVIIDPLPGAGTECIFHGTLNVLQGGKITVKPGKKLTIIPN
ncbi:MAG TPA: kelch repeat-containing protein [Chitinophagaceae bacterium]|nr:kelch repeat-containing protein [Chitinophagaceae bacterium]